MSPNPDYLQRALQQESKNFEESYHWLEAHMSPSFFEEIGENITIVTHNLATFHLQGFFSSISIKGGAIVLRPDLLGADRKTLQLYASHAIRYFRTFDSDQPFGKMKEPLHVTLLHFSEPKEPLAALRQSLPPERLALALEMYERAKTRDQCQYELRRNEDWKAKEQFSIQIVLAWKNAPMSGFLFRIADLIARHRLTMNRIVSSYVDAFTPKSTLVMSIALHGSEGEAAWEAADIDDFMRELVTLNLFDDDDCVKKVFVDTGLLSGNYGNLVRTMSSFIHQTLVHADPNLYSAFHIEEGLCRHPELTTKLCDIFRYKFHPEEWNEQKAEAAHLQLSLLIDRLDTGQPFYDTRRRQILRQGLNFIDHTLKTNFYRTNKTALAFRLDPRYLEQVPYDRKEKFPEIPYGIFYLRGRAFIGFHVRFKDLARGGLRTVIPEGIERFTADRNTLFAECYNLAYTQQKKNKDIPEGGSKGVILLEPFDRFTPEMQLYAAGLAEQEIDPKTIEERMHEMRKKAKLEYLYSSQRCFIESLLTLLHCNAKGELVAKDVVDYWKRPEYVYLGPDENAHDVMLDWIADYSAKIGYKLGKAFISSKPRAGINHKEYGVTSYGVNVYMHQSLLYLGIDPTKDPFTIKISGGPDGDVAGNQMYNLYRFYPKTARLLAITDVSGTIFDPVGLDLEEVHGLFRKGLPIRNYPHEKLNEGGFLLDLQTRREESAYAQQTLLWRRVNETSTQEWLSGNEMNHLFRSNLHRVKTDVFIPAGGRPRTLNEVNYKDFLDDTGHPTSRVIVEGANLYLTPGARRALEKLDCLIIKDSSANKGGVICSSFEVLSVLTLPEEEFLEKKHIVAQEILDLIAEAAMNEAKLLFKTHQKTGIFLTELSDQISDRINAYKYQLLDFLETVTLKDNPNDPFTHCLLYYCPALLRDQYPERIFKMVPDIHKKAIISAFLAARLVYKRGLDWSPNLVDILPLVVQDPQIVGHSKSKKEE